MACYDRFLFFILGLSQMVFYIPFRILSTRSCPSDSTLYDSISVNHFYLFTCLSIHVHQKDSFSQPSFYLYSTVCNPSLPIYELELYSLQGRLFSFLDRMVPSSLSCISLLCLFIHSPTLLSSSTIHYSTSKAICIINFRLPLKIMRRVFMNLLFLYNQLDNSNNYFLPMF